MPVIRPFRALRPKPEVAYKVASPPYDVLNSDEARELVKNNPISFLRVNKPEVDFESGADTYTDKVYDTGRENLERLISDGNMIRDDQPGFYLYRLTWQGQSQTGIACLTSVEDYNNGLIKKHEHTRPVKVDDRANHILKLNAQVGPVFSIFKKNDNIISIFETITSGAPNVDFTAEDSVRHELWVVNDEKLISSLVTEFGALDAVYIADGHHRSEAAAEVCRRMKKENSNHTGNEPYNFFLNVIFADSEVRILPYNRVIANLNDHELDQFLDKVSRNYQVNKTESPLNLNDDHTTAFYVSSQWYLLKSKPDSWKKESAADNIDAAILYENILKPLINITDIRTDTRIDFIGGIRGDKELERLVDSGKWKAAFSLAPVTVHQLLSVADANQVMPPKSTWFEPKLRSGMVVNILND